MFTKWDYTGPLSVALLFVPRRKKTGRPGFRPGLTQTDLYNHRRKKVQVGKDQEKAQSEKDSHSKNRGGKKTKLTIRYLYHENIS